MKRLTIDEETAVASVLAKMPTESTRHMGFDERVDGILQMLRDLYRLASEDGCIAAAWALEFAATRAVAADVETLGNLLPHNWHVYKMSDYEWWAGPGYEATANAYLEATGEPADPDTDKQPWSLEDFGGDFVEDVSPAAELLESYLSGKPSPFAGTD